MTALTEATINVKLLTECMNASVYTRSSEIMQARLTSKMNHLAQLMRRNETTKTKTAARQALEAANVALKGCTS